MKTTLGGIWDLIVHKREFDNIWGGAFNGQLLRRSIFKEIVKSCSPNLIVETGTFKGNTTEFMAMHSNCQIYTTEIDQRSFIYSYLRFILQKRIRVFRIDSRDFINRVLYDSQEDISVFYYLDAHWNENDTPLSRELDEILKDSRKHIIMIDDFKVPDDKCYGYDSYEDIELSLEKFIDIIENAKYAEYIFFPNSNLKETGAKRGCAILTNDLNYARILRNIPLLREHHLNSSSI